MYTYDTQFLPRRGPTMPDQAQTFRENAYPRPALGA